MTRVFTRVVSVHYATQLFAPAFYGTAVEKKPNQRKMGSRATYKDRKKRQHI